MLKAAGRADDPLLRQICILTAVIAPMVTRIRTAFTTGCVALLITTAIGTHASGVPSVRASQRLAYRAPRISSMQDSDPERLSPQEAKRVIAGRAQSVIQALKAGNIAKLSTFVHPQKGVRFSPYASVLLDQDRVIKKGQLAQMWASAKIYRWGEYDGSGDPIRLSFRKYHRRFIFDHDFSHAESVNYNPASMSQGNTPNNIQAVYPKSIAVGYHFSGFDPKVSGMDWSSLWLVFEKKGSEWYLVGIVHDEWTI
ncbi:MAG TPA: hypothetical protein VN476_09040 [Pyrinomonadaceae bacterium]|nr:hypothetical protein [Pyrinomonadaceae bacterium]